MTEPGSGSDSFAMRTRAVRDGDDWRINGSKTFISNGPEADVIIVFAITDPRKGYHGGVTAFLLEKGTPGFAASRKIEKRGSALPPLASSSFDDVRGSYSRPSSEDWAAARRSSPTAMDWERICLFRGARGSDAARPEAVGLRTRARAQQFGKAISKFQSVSHKLADFRVQLECARLLTYRAATRLDKTRGVALDAAMVKLVVSESLVKGAMDVLQILRRVRVQVPSTRSSAKSRDAIGESHLLGDLGHAAQHHRVVDGTLVRARPYVETSPASSFLPPGPDATSMTDSIASSIRAYILDAFLPGADASELTDDLSLISSGILELARDGAARRLARGAVSHRDRRARGHGRSPRFREPDRAAGAREAPRLRPRRRATS